MCSLNATLNTLLLLLSGWSPLGTLSMYFLAFLVALSRERVMAMTKFLVPSLGRKLEVEFVDCNDTSSATRRNKDKCSPKPPHKKVSPAFLGRGWLIFCFGFVPSLVKQPCTEHFWSFFAPNTSTISKVFNIYTPGQHLICA